MGHYPSIWSVLFADKKIYVYYGFLGDNNYGDELVYQATKFLFKDYILLPVSRYMPIGLRLFVEIKKSNIKGIVIGGGTLVGRFNMAEFFESLVKMGKPIYMHGTGVKEVIGESKSWGQVLKNGNYGGVRGPMSVKNISLIRPKMSIVGDAAFALLNNSNYIDRSTKKRVLINLGTHADYEGQQYFREQFNSFIGNLLSQKYIVDYLPFHEIDLELGNDLKLQFKEINILKQPQGFDDCAAIFSDCTFAVGERLHFTVMAIMTSSPFVSINYAKKHEDLLASLNIPELGLVPNLASSEKLLTAFDIRQNFQWEKIFDQMKDYKTIQFEEVEKFIK